VLLAIDVGNTNIVLGIYKGDELLFDWRVSSDKSKTSDEYGLLFRDIFQASNIELSSIEDIIISSVVPNLMHSIPAACERYINIKPLVVDHNTDTGIVNKYYDPMEVGADRLVNAAAGFNKYGGPLIIVDIGTAITFDYINKDGEYLGGAIAPGIGISSEALFMKTAKLPKVELEVPNNVIGNTTKKSIQSGFIFGYVGLVDFIIEAMIKELDLDIEDVVILGTGGYSKLIFNNTKYVKKIDHMLTLEGLKHIYERNKKNR